MQLRSGGYEAIARLRAGLRDFWGALTISEVSGAFGDLGTFLPLLVSSATPFYSFTDEASQLKHVPTYIWVKGAEICQLQSLKIDLSLGATSEARR